MEDDVLEAISNVQRYIADNLNESLTLFQLARVANYSVCHLERLFKEAVGTSLFAYIRKLRLTAAAKTLRDNDVKIIDTAFDYRFDSHEGFTRAFSKQFGISPYAYKKSPVPVPYFMAYDVIAQKAFQKKKEQNEMKTKTVFTQVVERPQRLAIIKRGIRACDYFTYCEEAGCEVWGILSSVKEALFEPSGYWLPPTMIRPGTSEYVQGVEVPISYKGAVPEGFERIELPPCKLMVFNGEPYDDADFMDEVGAVWEAIERFKPQSFGYEWDAAQPRFQLEPRGERGYIEARPVKEIL